MSSLAFPVLLELKSSRRLSLFLLAIHGVAVAACLFTPWPLWGQALFLLLLAGNFFHARHCLARQPRQLILTENGSLYLDFSTGEQKPFASGNAPEDLCLARPRPGALALPWLCAFSWRGEEASGSGSLVLLSDSFSSDGADSLRRLNIWLSWKR